MLLAGDIHHIQYDHAPLLSESEMKALSTKARIARRRQLRRESYALRSHAEQASFREIIVSKDAPWDHMPENYMTALARLLKKARKAQKEK